MSNAFVIIKMCYVHNQWYDISCTTLYIECATVYDVDFDVAFRVRVHNPRVFELRCFTSRYWYRVRLQGLSSVFTAA